MSAGLDGRDPKFPDSSSVRVAVLDVDRGFLQVLTNRLQTAGWEHRVLAGAVPLDALVAMRLGALIVDPAVLGPHAGSYLQKLREGLPALGIIVCTGPSSVAQRVRGLRAGADDWLTKPCHPEEVIARLEAVVRRRRRADARRPDGATVVGEVEIRADLFQAFVGGLSVDLTRREFELIELLAETRGQVMPREEIYERVWGYAMARGDRSVDVFVRKLRQKLELRSPGWGYIHTHFGIGYRLAPEPLDGTSGDPSQPGDGARRERAREASGDGSAIRTTSGSRTAAPVHQAC